MIFLDFAHPLTADQHAQIEALTDQTVERVVEIDSQIDPQRPLALNFSAVTLLAELHGHCGYFPPCLRMRPVPNSVPPRYEVAEVLDLQAVRDRAR